MKLTTVSSSAEVKNVCTLVSLPPPYAVMTCTGTTLPSFGKRPTNAQGNSGFFINTFQFYPEMLRHTVANLRESWVPYKLPKRCSMLWAYADYESSRVASCGMCPHVDTHTPMTQNTAWIAYRTLTTPWGWQPYAETCRGRIGTY
jgi:hypothetical protein